VRRVGMSTPLVLRWWRKRENKETVVQPLVLNNVCKATFKVSLATINEKDGEDSVRGLGIELRDALVGDGTIALPYNWSSGSYCFGSKRDEQICVKVPYAWLATTNDVVISYMPCAQKEYSSDACITIIAKDFEALRKYTEKLINILSNLRDLKILIVSILTDNTTA